MDVKGGEVIFTVRSVGAIRQGHCDVQEINLESHQESQESAQGHYFRPVIMEDPVYCQAQVLVQIPLFL